MEYINEFCPKYNIKHNPLAQKDMEKAISLMTDDDISFYDKKISNTIRWNVVEKILSKNGIKTKFKSVKI